MSPELIKAIKERIQSGHTKESIRNEVLAMGYTEALFDAAYVLAEHDVEVAPTPTFSAVPRTLTSVHVLVREAISFACDRWGLVLLLAFPLVLLAILAELQMRFEGNLPMVGVLSGVSIVVMILYLLNMLVTLFLVSRGDQLERATYSQAFHWTKKNILGIFFVYLLTTLAVLGGFVLFIVPGFVVLVLVYFSQYIFVVEGKRGMSALLRSRDLVKGRGFEVFKKIVGLTLYFLVPVFLATLVVAIVDSFYSLEKLRLLGEVVTQVATAFFAVISMYVMFRLYRELAEGNLAEPTKSARVGYWMLVGIGAVAIPLILIAAVFLNGVNALKETVPLPAQNAHLIQQMGDLDMVAEEHKTVNGTFAGVCEPLKNTVATDGQVVCNSNEAEWALSVTEGETTWCMDSKQVVPKKIPAGIDGRTTCISL